jgi:hypothetical protein
MLFVMLHAASVSSTDATQIQQARVQVHQMYNCTITIVLQRANKISHTLRNNYQGSTNFQKIQERPKIYGSQKGDMKQIPY